MSDQSLYLFTALEVAEELALRDAEMLRRITPEEITNGAWMDNKNKELLAPNIMEMVHAFNSLAQLVPTEVLVEEHLHQRAEVISAYIKIAKKCYELKNYNSLNAVLAGLLCTPLHRLKKTWKVVPSKRKRQLTYLTKLMSEESNWKLYRKELSKQTSTSSTCIVFLGVFLSHVVRYEAYRKLRNKRNSVHSPPTLQQKKVSMYETFTVLEAITVRQRLESLRLSQLGGRQSVSRSRERMLDIDEDVDYNMGKECFHKAILTGKSDEMCRASEERLLLGLNGSEPHKDAGESDGDVSPDLPWAEEVCREADSKTLAQDHSLMKRSRSLEQLLQACQLTEPLNSETEMTELSRSQSMPRLLSGTLQVWTDEMELETGNSDSSEADGTHSHSEILFPSVEENGVNVEVECNGKRENNTSRRDQKQSVNSSCSGVLPRRSSDGGTVPILYREHVATLERKSITHTPKTSLVLSCQRRKRHTASDEMDVLQLHMAREQPSLDPVIMLKQYQVLSLGYSMKLTSSPYIRSLLSSCKPATETHNYRRSYILES